MSSLGQWLLSAPLWLIFVILFAGSLIAAQAGAVLRQNRGARLPTSDKRSERESFALSTVMGLLALLIGFTFALAIDRFDQRRANVVLEANAIGTTYLRAQMLDEPHRARISRMLVDYTDNRITLAQAQPGPSQSQSLARNDALLTDLWAATVAAFPSMKPYVLSGSFLETMNQMIDIDTARKAGRRASVPVPVFVLLFIYQLVAAGMFGYVMFDMRGQLISAWLLFLFTLSVVFVVDIDRPVSGLIQESQRPMLDLQASLHANPPNAYDRLKSASPVPQ